MPPSYLLQIPEEALRALPDDPDAEPFIVGQLALIAAMEEAEASGDRDRAKVLIDIAFLSLVRARDVFRRLGLRVTPFPNETLEERGARALRAAEHVRRVLEPGDEAVFEAARLRSLR